MDAETKQVCRILHCAFGALTAVLL